MRFWLVRCPGSKAGKCRSEKVGGGEVAGEKLVITSRESHTLLILLPHPIKLSSHYSISSATSVSISYILVPLFAQLLITNFR